MYHGVVREGPSHGHRPPAHKFGKFSRAVFELNPSGQKHKYTDRQTNIGLLITIFRYRGEVKISGQEVQ